MALFAKNNRITNDWTPTAAEAFGPTGAKGDAGEAFVVNTLRNWGWDVIHNPADTNKQTQGIDIEFKKPEWRYYYSADVKANLKNGSFFVETDDNGWLFREGKISDRIWHVDITTGRMVWYGRDEMKRYIESTGKRNTGTIPLHYNRAPSFCTKR